MRTRDIKNLAGLLEWSARARPTHPAIIHGDRILNYADLTHRVRKMAQVLRERGISKGDFLGIGLKDSIDHLVALFAAMRIGVVFVPFDHRWTGHETRLLAEHFAIKALLCEPGGASAGDVESIVADEKFLQAVSDARGDAPLIEDDDLPMLLSLSSGTTGRPTGPLLTHGQMWARTENQLAALTFNQHDRYLLATPLYFGGGRAFALTHLLIGATLVLFPPPFKPQQLVEAIRRNHATSTFLVPTMIRRLLAEDDTMLVGMASLRLLVTSGAPLHAEERSAVTERLCPGFMEYFASTEGGGITVSTPADRKENPNSVGRAAFRVELQVVDDDHQPMAPDLVGLVRYRGPGVATSFYNDAEKSSKAFRDGWFYPGDLGQLDTEGYLTLMGRAKNVIIRGGVNIYPQEIEEVLDSLPEIVESAAFGVPDKEMGEIVTVAVVQSGPPDPTALDKQCRERLAPYKCPSRYCYFETLPRNAAGKVLLSEIRDLVMSGQIDCKTPVLR